MKITIPYKPRDYQLEVHNDKSKFRSCVFHRQAGKTTMAINELIKKALETPNQVFWFISPTYGMSKENVWKAPDGVFKFLPKEAILKKNEVELTIYLKNGSLIVFKGADNPDTLRGSRPRGVVIDEYGDCKEELWDKVLRPIMTAHEDAWCLFIGTPKGRNHFWITYNRGVNEEGQWKSWLLKASESGVIPKTALEEAQAESTEAAYKQEYECDFIEDATAVFKNVETHVRVDDVDIEPEYGKEYKLGIDLARHNDWTVITVVDLHTFQCDVVDRFNKIDWALQKSRIETEAFRFNGAMMTVDATGIGSPVTEDLKDKGLNVEEFVFTEKSRRQLLENLIVLLDRSKITLPNNQTLINELKSFKYDVTPSGRMTMKVPGSAHDDTVMSLALAVWGLRDPHPEPTESYSNVMKIDYNFD